MTLSPATAPELVIALMTGWQAVAQALLKTVKLFTDPLPSVPAFWAVAATPTRMLGPIAMVTLPTKVQVTASGDR
jgi:hypothetical protein